MRKLLYLVAEAAEGVALDPWPGADVGDGVFPFSGTGQVVARFARVFARELDFEHAVDAQRFVLESVDCGYIPRSVPRGNGLVCDCYFVGIGTFRGKGFMRRKGRYRELFLR